MSLRDYDKSQLSELNNCQSSLTKIFIKVLDFQ